MEFWKNAAEIRTDFTRYLMNENKVPKRWRFVFTMPGIDYVRKLMDEIIAANTIYPTTESELAQRRYHQNEAIVICEQIIQHIQWMIETLGLSLKDFENIYEKISKEIGLLKAWRKQNRVLKQKLDL